LKWLKTFSWIFVLRDALLIATPQTDQGDVIA